MTTHKEFAETAGRKQAKARAAIVFLLWVLLILAQLGFFFAVLGEKGKLVKSLPKKARFFDTQSFHAPPSQAQPVDIEGDSGMVYEYDKRIIHTGPNPLHN